MNVNFDSATLKRGIRVFVVAFLAIDPAPALLGVLSGSQPLDVGALRSAAVAGFAAVLIMGWNAFYDPSPLPSLKAERTP